MYCRYTCIENTTFPVADHLDLFFCTLALYICTYMYRYMYVHTVQGIPIYLCSANVVFLVEITWTFSSAHWHTYIHIYMYIHLVEGAHEYAHIHIVQLHIHLDNVAFLVADHLHLLCYTLAYIYIHIYIYMYIFIYILICTYVYLAHLHTYLDNIAFLVADNLHLLHIGLFILGDLLVLRLERLTVLTRRIAPLCI